jgi:hypothetical protein
MNSKIYFILYSDKSEIKTFPFSYCTRKNSSPIPTATFISLHYYPLVLLSRCRFANLVPNRCPKDAVKQQQPLRFQIQSGAATP